MMRALLAATIFCLLVALAPVILAAFLLVAAVPAQASHRHHWHPHSGCFLAHCDRCLIYGRRGQCYQHFSRAHLRRHFGSARISNISRLYAHRRGQNGDFRIRSDLPAPCRVAASMGGPCGCWAEWVLLGRLEHVIRDAIGAWNPWLADDWSRHYPHVAPAPGTAAVWPHRHVAPVLAVHNDGTVTVRDSWAVHRVRVAGLVFVQPPSQRRRELIRWPSVVPL